MKNLFSGALADELTEMTNLESLIMPRNSLNGNIPASIGELRSLKQLDLECV